MVTPETRDTHIVIHPFSFHSPSSYSRNSIQYFNYFHHPYIFFHFFIILGNEGNDGGESTYSSDGELRVKTAPTKRKSWQPSDVDLRTDGGQLVHIEAPGKEEGGNGVLCLLLDFLHGIIQES